MLFQVRGKRTDQSTVLTFGSRVEAPLKYGMRVVTFLLDTIINPACAAKDLEFGLNIKDLSSWESYLAKMNL